MSQSAVSRLLKFSELKDQLRSSERHGDVNSAARASVKPNAKYRRNRENMFSPTGIGGSYLF
jgi:hypothetical protein